MNSKCNYCWTVFKGSKILVDLKCGHIICNNCLIFLNYRNFKYCPLCSKEIAEVVFSDNLKGVSVQNLSPIPSQNHQDSIQERIRDYKVVSKYFLSRTVPLKQLNRLKNFDFLLPELQSKSPLKISNLLSVLEIIKENNLLEITKLTSSFFHLVYKSKLFERKFLKILLEKILYNQVGKSMVWLGELEVLQAKRGSETFYIKNTCQSPILLYSIGFGINLLSPNKFSYENIYLNKPGFEGYQDSKDFIKEDNKICFSINFPAIQIESDETLKIFFECDEGIYIGLMNKQVHCFENWSFIATNSGETSLITQLRFC